MTDSRAYRALSAVGLVVLGAALLWCVFVPDRADSDHDSGGHPGEARGSSRERSTPSDSQLTSGGKHASGPSDSRATRSPAGGGNEAAHGTTRDQSSGDSVGGRRPKRVSVKIFNLSPAELLDSDYLKPYGVSSDTLDDATRREIADLRKLLHDQYAETHAYVSELVRAAVAAGRFTVAKEGVRPPRNHLLHITDKVMYVSDKDAPDAFAVRGTLPLYPQSYLTAVLEILSRQRPTPPKKGKQR